MLASELDSHDVIFAEGATSETSVDQDSRGMFHNVNEYHAFYPDQASRSVQCCAPRLEEGHVFEATRRRIARRAGIGETPSRGPTPLRGFIDVIDESRIEGWAQNPAFPEAPVCLEVYVGHWHIGRVLADRHRADLERAGGSGRHGFAFVNDPVAYFAAWPPRRSQKLYSLIPSWSAP